MPVERIVVLPALDVTDEPAGDTPAATVIRAVHRAVNACPTVGAVVLLVPGTEYLVHDVRSVRAPWSSPRPVVTAPELLAAVASRGQAPRVQARELAGSGGVLASILLHDRPALRLVPVSVPWDADATALAATAAGLAGAVRAAAEPVVLAALGDLGADRSLDGSDGIDADPEAADRRLAAAFEQGDLEALAELRPQAAHEGHGWASLFVTATLAGSLGLDLRVLAIERLEGIGRLVACGP